MKSPDIIDGWFFWNNCTIMYSPNECKFKEKFRNRWINYPTFVTNKQQVTSVTIVTKLFEYCIIS